MSKADTKDDGAISKDWDVDFTDDSKKWKDMDGGEKAKTAAILIAKICVILLSLYLFICSLSFLASGFRLVAGRQAGEVFGNSMVFNNPIAGSAYQPTPSNRARARPRPSMLLPDLQ